MSSIVVQEFITLDGVIQAPGGSTEDDERGFPYGGWQMDFDRERGGGNADDNVVVEWEERTEALLLGRRTYDIWSQAWGVWPEDAPGLQGEFTRRYNRVPKYVASRTLTELGWKNSQLLGDDVPGAVAALREQPGGEIRVWGSANLIQTLGAHGLVDEYRLMVYPIVLGTGKKLFPDGFPRTTFDVAETRTLASGVQINVYRKTSA
ncbi:dihydrofolate reductase family protein [Leifsonia naganoensis]|uniref:Dihydrofolate reductase n=1 Tax=Leifsonia naganoensis TaxID=150025 RepID=A0A853DVI0_9MICO|nr:dihydrofolate reductase family protein [Leifsonia naganoensis]NYK11863.1 dihydrofolate reductase [Leifsonia naganoensis]